MISSSRAFRIYQRKSYLTLGSEDMVMVVLISSTPGAVRPVRPVRYHGGPIALKSPTSWAGTFFFFPLPYEATRSS